MYPKYIRYICLSRKIYGIRKFMENVTIKLPEEVKEKLERLAIDDRRSLSSFVRNIVLDWLEEQEDENHRKEETRKEE